MDKKYVETVEDALPSGDVFIQLEDIAYINGPLVVLRNKAIKLTPLKNVKKRARNLKGRLAVESSL